jgi:hypothetical protein
MFIERAKQVNRWRFSPGFDGGYSQVLAESVSETTDSIWGLNLGSEKRQQWWIRPRMDINYEAPFGRDSLVGFDVSVGRRIILSERQEGGGAVMQEAPGGTSPMYTNAFVDDAQWESELGIYWMTRAGIQIKASYWHAAGEYRKTEEAKVSFSIPLQ